MQGLNKTVALLAVLAVVAVVMMWVPACKKKVMRIFRRPDDSAAIVTSKEGILLTASDFSERLRYWQRTDPAVQFVSILPFEKQREVYTRMLNEYVITRYLINTYLGEQGVTKEKEFLKEKELCMQFFEATFNAQYFQKKLLESMPIDAEQVKSFYEQQRTELPAFMKAPFTLEEPGIMCRFVQIEEGKDVQDYLERLKAGKDVSSIGPVNRCTYGMSPRVIDVLETMKDGEARAIEVESGAKVALYRVESHAGSWATYDAVADQIKEVYSLYRLQEVSNQLIEELRAKHAIAIDEKNLERFIKKIDVEASADVEQALKKVEELAAEGVIAESEAEGSKAEATA